MVERRNPPQAVQIQKDPQPPLALQSRFLDFTEMTAMMILTVGDERDLQRNPPAVRQELPLKAQSATKILKWSR